jgi:hypothetical protein
MLKANLWFAGAINLDGTAAFNVDRVGKIHRFVLSMFYMVNRKLSVHSHSREMHWLCRNRNLLDARELENRLVQTSAAAGAVTPHRPRYMVHQATAS